MEANTIFYETTIPIFLSLLSFEDAYHLSITCRCARAIVPKIYGLRMEDIAKLSAARLSLLVGAEAYGMVQSYINKNTDFMNCELFFAKAVITEKLDRRFVSIFERAGLWKKDDERMFRNWIIGGPRLHEIHVCGDNRLKPNCPGWNGTSSVGLYYSFDTGRIIHYDILEMLFGKDLLERESDVDYFKFEDKIFDCRLANDWRLFWAFGTLPITKRALGWLIGRLRRNGNSDRCTSQIIFVPTHSPSHLTEKFTGHRVDVSEFHMKREKLINMVIPLMGHQYVSQLLLNLNEKQVQYYVIEESIRSFPRVNTFNICPHTNEQISDYIATSFKFGVESYMLILADLSQSKYWNEEYKMKYKMRILTQYHNQPEWRLFRTKEVEAALDIRFCTCGGLVDLRFKSDIQSHSTCGRFS
jgi:hypothetical protein